MARAGRFAAFLLLLAAVGEASRQEPKQGLACDEEPAKAEALLEVDRSNASSSRLGTLHFASARTHFSIPCGAVEGMECDGQTQLHLHGPDLASACKIDEHLSRAQRFFKVKKWFESNDDCSGDTQYSQSRSRVELNGQSHLCCLCPPRAVWSSLSDRCVCPHSGPGELAPVKVPIGGGKKKSKVSFRGVCFESADSAMVAQARRVSGADTTKARTATARHENNTRDQPALMQMAIAKEWCQIHRELDEMAPPSTFGNAVVRLGLGIDAGAWGFIYGVGIDVIDVLDFQATITLTEEPEGLTMTFVEQAAPTIQVGVGALKLFLRSGAQEVYSTNNDNYVLKVGGKLSGRDLVASMKNFGSSTGVSFDVVPESYRLGSLHSKNLVTVNALTNELLKAFKDKIMDAIEAQVVAQLSTKLFSLIALNADSLLKDFKSAYDGINPYPLTLRFTTNRASGADIKLNVEIFGGVVNELQVIPVGLVSPSVGLTVKTATAGQPEDELKFNATVSTGLNTQDFLEAQAASSLGALMKLAMDTSGPSYEQEVAKLGEAPETGAEASGGGGGTCNAEKVRNHAMGVAYESWAGLTRWGLGATIYVGGGLVNTVSGAWGWAKSLTGYGPTASLDASLKNPGEGRAELEASIYELWLRQNPELVGMMSRTVTSLDPQYYMLGLAPPAITIKGRLVVTVEGHARARVTGRISVPTLTMAKLKYDYLAPKPCHRTGACASADNWQGAYAVSTVTGIKLKDNTPLTLDIHAQVEDNKVSLCAEIVGEMKIDYGATGVLVNLVLKAYEDMLKELVENMLESTLAGVVGSAVSHFHKQGLKSFTIDLDLDTTRAATVTVIGQGSYSALGNNQARKAAIPLEVPPPLGKAWLDLWRTMAVSDADAHALSPKLSLEPEAWVKPGWAYAVDSLLPGLDVTVNADPARSMALTVGGTIDLNLANLIRPFGNDQGMWFYGNHLAAAGMVRLTFRNVAQKLIAKLGADSATNKEFEAVVSCGSIFFTEKKSKSDGRTYAIAGRRDDEWTTDLTGTGAATFAPMPSSHKDACASGFTGFVGRSDDDNSYSVCVSTGSSLHKAIQYELARKVEIARMLESGGYSGSEPWDVMGTPAQTQPFDWVNKESLSGACATEVRKCAEYFLCQGVASGLDPVSRQPVCEYVSFAEVHALTASGGRVAWKRWSVGPPNYSV